MLALPTTDVTTPEFSYRKTFPNARRFIGVAGGSG
jgi:hypothetical protein